MNRFLIFSAAGLLASFIGCQKQQSEAERNAEVERQVNERLAAEHQAQEQQRLVQRQDELDARLRELNEQQRAAASTPEPQRTETERSTRETFEAQPAASYSMFYTKLEPFGVWRETPTYGYVWQPREAMQSRSWRPYTNGHWIYTDAGWTWISEEPFGWAAYHYGRWMRLRGIGWVWVPGSEWAPAWVSWRTSNDYVGWAPLPPEARFERDAGIKNWADGYYDIGPEQYCFVPTREIGTQRIERVVVPPEQNVTIVNQTTNVTNITYNNSMIVNQGPNYDELRARSQQPIQHLRLERRTTVEMENPRPIVKGEVVEMPAPVIAATQPVERPATVRETVAAVVERGWEGIADQQAVQRARAKIKSEATPPPNAPPKTFIKPAPATGQTRATVPSPRPIATAIARSTITPPATSVVQTPTPTQAVRPTQTPIASRAAAPSAPPTEGAVHTATPIATPTPAMLPTRLATATPRPTATAVATPTAIARPTFSPRPSATAAFSPTPAASPTFGRAGTKEQREAQKELRKQERAARKQERLERATPTPAATATASVPASASPGAAESPGKHKKRPGEAATSPTATPTASPSR